VSSGRIRASRLGPRSAALAAALAAATIAAPAAAQQAAQGFALDRLYTSGPGGGWLAMDTLDMHGGLGGAIELTTNYAHHPFEVTDGVRHVSIVGGQAFTDFGFAGTYGPYRLYLNLPMPVYSQGSSSVIGRYSFTAESINLGSHPDSLGDARIGADARLYGEPHSPFRFGASAQLFVPTINPAAPDLSDYDTDSTFRAMGRALVAGDTGMFTYAGQLGVHLRPRDDTPGPGPQGSELLFGAAAGVRLAVPWSAMPQFVVGPELYGATAFRSFLGTTSTAFEGLLSGRLEGTGDAGPQLRVKLGLGGGIDQHFGAPQWRVVFAIEMFDHGTDKKL
jgi:hypothetical protein